MRRSFNACSKSFSVNVATMQPVKTIHYFSASSYLFVARAVGAAAMFASQILMARMISADALALYFLSTSTATVAGTMAALGYPYIMAAMLGRYHDPRRTARANAFIAVSRSAALLTGSLFGFLLAICFIVYPYTPWDERVCFLLAIPGIPMIALMRTNSAFALARSRVSTAYLGTILWRPVIFLFLALYAVLVLHLEDAAVFTGLFTAIAVVWAFLQAYELRGETKAPAIKADRRLSRLWRRAAMPFIVVSMVSLLIVDMDTLLAGTVLTRKDLAVFGVCLKLAFFGGFIVDVLRELVAPELGRCYARRDIAAIQKNIARTNLAAIGGTAAMMIGAILFGRIALNAFGPDYAAGKYTLITLVAVQLVNACGGPHTVLLSLKGAQHRMNSAYAAAAAVLVVFTLVLAPMLGTFGAALAVLAAFVTLNIMLATSVWQLMGIRGDIWGLLHMRKAKFVTELPRAAN
jgi:O-antigen/teichoic acid export membrane protein